MRIRLDNKSPYRDDDLRALVQGALRAVGAELGAAQRRDELLVIVKNGPGPLSSGYAYYGSRRGLGHRMMLRVPAPSEWDDESMRDFVATIIHECMHLIGVRHRDMTEAQRLCTGPLPEWAAGLALRTQPAPSAADIADRRAALRADRVEHARSMLKRATTRVKRAETILKRWRRRVAALERGGHS